jgi:hypothetical protein
MTNEEKAAILRQARANSAAPRYSDSTTTARETADPAWAWPAEHGLLPGEPEPESKMDRWRREAEEQEAVKEALRSIARNKQIEQARQQAEAQRQAEEAAAQEDDSLLRALQAIVGALDRFDERIEALEKALKENTRKAAEIADIPGPFLKPRLVS